MPGTGGTVQCDQVGQQLRGKGGAIAKFLEEGSCSETAPSGSTSSVHDHDSGDREKMLGAESYFE